MADVQNRTNRGALAFMANHPVAANLLMFILVLAGVLGVLRTKQEVFPEFTLDSIVVSVPYPGASPADIEQGIVLAVEEAVRGVEGVKRVTSTAADGLGSVSVELLLDAAAEQVLADVKNEVDRIQSFPEEAEEATVSLAKRRQSVVSLVFGGDQDLRTLHELAENARARLLGDARVTQVEIEGVPPLEVAIEVPRETLEKYGLTLQQISQEVSRASLELPGGGIDSERGEILVRVADRRLAGFQFGDIVLHSTVGGAEVRLGDIATITDGYEDTDQASYFNGSPAVRLTAFRVGEETPTAVSDAVHEFAEAYEAELPAGISMAVWADQSELLESRIDLLTRNALMGLLLVVCVLALFLDVRLAFWVASGIPISFLGAFVVLGTTEFSINMITLFAFIVTLGMVVDDAIVIGERTHALLEEGKSRKDAAIGAVQEMAVPVTFAILTTVAAFSPLFFVPGVMGKIFRMIPIVVVAVLVLSLVECFFVLPGHLAHGKARRLPRQGLLGAIARGHASINHGLQRFIDRTYRPLVAALLRVRYLTLAVAVAVLALTVGWVVSGRLPFNFFPTLEGDVVTVQARLPYGVPVARTQEVRAAFELASREAISANGGPDFVRGTFTRVGQSAPPQGPGGGQAEIGSHLVTVELNLVPSEDRSFSSSAFAASWRESSPELSGVESISFESAGGPSAGADVAVQLSHEDIAALAASSTQLDEVLREYPRLKNFRNEYTSGKPRLDFHLRPEARALGLTGDDLARQLRGSFYGAEAIREQRGRNELKVMVRLPESQRRSEHDIDRLMVRTPSAADVPLGYVAEFERDHAPTVIRREDGRRYVNVTADLAEGVPSSREVLSDLQDRVFPEFELEYPGIGIDLVGAQREQQEAFASIGQNTIMALFVIFALLAIPFRSYAQPLIIMTAIPFGFVGAVLGHMLLGYSLSMLSVLGIVALSGVVVNDSLVLVDAVNRGRRGGKAPGRAVVDAGAERFRPIMLTSLTTFFGLVPMIAEQSMQARFLIPMAISLGFGVLFTTFVVLLVVPPLYLIIEDLRSFRSVDDAGADVSH